MRIFALLILLLAVLCGDSLADDRPNLLWISCEDISSHLGCYGDPFATTPNLDALASESVRFTHAFTCHGVCAPSRTGIITGMYPISLGANHMRSKATLPAHVKCFPQYLKQAGYYCTNQRKTDYNFHWKTDDVWNESSGRAHWKNRPQPDQPFFAVFNLTVTHESRIWEDNWRKAVKGIPEDQRHNPDKITLPDLYPDTPAVRKAHARLLDLIMVMDRQVGSLLKEIEVAGLAEDTIVIFWSDHGNGFPRAKRWVYDSGTRVPLIVRIPEKFRRPGQGDPGTTSDQLVNLIDLGPTCLNFAGVKIPSHMHGQPFAGPNIPETRQYIFGARDRIDERFDMVRSVRDRRYRYVRNYHTWRPALQQLQYAENSVVRQEMRRTHADGTLHTRAAQFLNAPRAFEELYDLQADPWEMNNLAAAPEHAETVARLSEVCDAWQISSGDVHLIPESQLAEEESSVGDRWSILHKSEDGVARLERLMEIGRKANTAATHQAALVSAFRSEDAAVRWWAITGLAQQPTKTPEIHAVIQQAANDSAASVRVAAARALHLNGKSQQARGLLLEQLRSDSEFVRHAAINAIDEMGPAPDDTRKVIASLGVQNKYISRIAEHILNASPKED